MNRETFDKLPYISRKELIDLRSFIIKAFESNAHLIYEDPKDSVLYQYMDYTGQYSFNIKFHEFEKVENRNLYNIYFSPRSESRLEGTSHIGDLKQIKESFDHWVKLVAKMHQVTSEYYDPYKTFYDEQFAEYFTNNDEDSDLTPFEIEKQEIIYYFLTYAEKVISTSDDVESGEKSELLKDLSQLKNDIPNLTKKRFVASFSKFAQKTKKFSNKVFHEVFDVLKKEVIKKLLYEAADQLPTLLNKIKGWLSVLN